MKSFIFNLNDEIDVDLLGLEVLHQLVGSFRRSSCREQVIVDEHHIVFIDRVEVHLDGVDTLFLRERFLDNS